MHHADRARDEYLRALAQRLAAAPHGSQGELLDQAAAFLQVSRQTVYRQMRAAGWSSGRALRADRGDSRVSEVEVRKLAALMHASRRQTDKRLLTAADAIDIGLQNGLISTRVAPETLLRLMRQFRCHPDQLAQESAHTALRSLHPNHVWEIDYSTCVLYRLRNRGLQVMDSGEFYKNKVVRAATHELLLRCLTVDHTSGAFRLRYVLAPGETEALIREHLLWSFGQVDQQLMHGVPMVIYWDRGAGNTAHATWALLDGLGVRHLEHETGNSRATGAVEVHQNIVERRFEGRLAFLKVESLEQLNSLAHEWSRAYNATEKHSRHGHTRWACWQMIRPEQLRICPPLDVCQQLLHSKPEPRRVTGNLLVHYTVRGHAPAVYSVGHVPGVVAGDQVLITINPYRPGQIFVLREEADGTRQHYECAPVAEDRNGFLAQAPVIGERYAAQKDSDLDVARKAADEAAWGTSDSNEITKQRKRGAVAFAGEIDAFADVRKAAESLPEHIARRGTPLDLPNRASVVLRPLELIDALQALATRLQRNLQPDEAAWVSAQHPDGIPEDALPQLLERLRAGIDTPAARPAFGGLRLVSGGN